jgi:hypothetical protein
MDIQPLVNYPGWHPSVDRVSHLLKLLLDQLDLFFHVTQFLLGHSAHPLPFSVLVSAGGKSASTD